MSLADSDLVAFISTTEPARAAAFYGGTLGLRLVSETPFALVYDARGTMLRVTTVEHLSRAPYTVLGWAVADIEQTVGELGRAGIEFARYGGLNQDERSVWTSPSGARIVWFEDPDGNVLSLTQF